jgi:GNAT superfamily N-acetyltransferase
VPDPAVIIRPVGADQRAEWERLWQAYLQFYGASQSPRETEATWKRLHDPDEPMFALGACTRTGADLRGIVHYLFHRSFWTTADYCYLQDLFVAENARGSGFGRALIESVADKALEAGACRVYWLTREDNHKARVLYDKVASRTGFIQYKMQI